MKTEQEVVAARDVVCRQLKTPGWSDLETANLVGIIVALNWVAEGVYSMALQQRLDSWKIEPGVPGATAPEERRHLSN